MVVLSNMLYGVSRLHKLLAYEYSSQLNSFPHFCCFFYYRFDPLHANRYSVLMFHKPTWSCGLSYDGVTREDVDVTPESSVVVVVLLTAGIWMDVCGGAGSWYKVIIRYSAEPCDMKLTCSIRHTQNTAHLLLIRHVTVKSHNLVHHLQIFFFFLPFPHRWRFVGCSFYSCLFPKAQLSFLKTSSLTEKQRRAQTESEDRAHEDVPILPPSWENAGVKVERRSWRRVRHHWLTEWSKSKPLTDSKEHREVNFLCTFLFSISRTLLRLHIFSLNIPYFNIFCILLIWFLGYKKINT